MGGSAAHLPPLQDLGSSGLLFITGLHPVLLDFGASPLEAHCGKK